jgi:hypothetical protein
VELTKPSSIYEYEPQESGGKMVVDKHGAKMEHDYANMFSKVNIKDEPNSQFMIILNVDPLTNTEYTYIHA